MPNADAPFALQLGLSPDAMRHMARALGCLDKLGRDLYLEADPATRQLALRTISAAQSAFLVFTLRDDFFDDFIASDASKPVSLKLHLKNVVAIFRSAVAIKKLWIQVTCGADSYMRVQQECQNGMRKKFDLTFEEAEPISAEYTKEQCAHRISVAASTVLACLSNFPTRLAEVTLLCTPDAIRLKNDPEEVVLDDQKDVGLRTEMSLAADTLAAYRPGPMRPEGVPVTFCLREFRAVLNTLKELDQLCVIHIEGPGKPIILANEPPSNVAPPFHMECVLATVVESGFDDVFFDDDGCEDVSVQPPPAYGQPVVQPQPAQQQYSQPAHHYHQPGAYSSGFAQPSAAAPGMPPPGVAPGASSGPACYSYVAASFDHSFHQGSVPPAQPSREPPQQDSWRPQQDEWPRQQQTAAAGFALPNGQAGGSANSAEGHWQAAPASPRAVPGGGSDTEEDEDAIPGTPPESKHASKRICSDESRAGVEHTPV